MFLGADTEAVRAMGRAAGIGRRRGDELLDALDAAVHRAVWGGADAEAFRTRWDGALAHARVTFADMERRGEELIGQALAQDLASAAEKALGPPVPLAGAVYDDEEQDVGPYIPTLFGPINDGGEFLLTGWSDVRDDIPLDDPASYGIAAMNQRGLEDCVTVAFLGGLSEQDPQYFMDRLEQIGPGVYDVTLYEDGEPVVVRVEGFVPSEGARGSDGLQSWMTLYEAALMQQGVLESDGGYGPGGPGSVIEAVTGAALPRDELYIPSWTDPEHNTEIDPYGHDLSIEQISALVRDDYTVVVGTDSTDFPYDPEFVETHAYLVTGGDGESLQLENPWGVGDGYGGENGVRAPQVDSLYESFTSFYIAPPREEWVEEH